MWTISKTGVRGESTCTACLVLLTHEVVSHGTRTTLSRWVTCIWAVALLCDGSRRGLLFWPSLLPDPEYPALPVLQTLMNAPSRISVSLGPARTCLGCSAVPVMMAMNWTGVEATAQV